MNQLNFTTGGIPLNLDDLDFQFAALKEAFENFYKEFGSEIVLNGCEVTETATHYEVAAGYVIIENEPCIVEAQSIAKNSLTIDNFGLSILETPSGTKQLEDGGTHNVRLVRKAVLFENRVAEQIRLHEVESKRISEVIRPIKEDNFTFLNSATSALVPVKVQREGKTIRFSGLINCTQTDLDGNDFISISSDYRPVEQREFLLFSGLAEYPSRIVVKPTGLVLIQMGSNQTKTFDLSVVSYFVK